MTPRDIIEQLIATAAISPLAREQARAALKSLADHEPLRDRRGCARRGKQRQPREILERVITHAYLSPHEYDDASAALTVLVRRDARLERIEDIGAPDPDEFETVIHKISAALTQIFIHGTFPNADIAGDAFRGLNHLRLAKDALEALQTEVTHVENFPLDETSGTKSTREGRLRPIASTRAERPVVRLQDYVKEENR